MARFPQLVSLYSLLDAIQLSILEKTPGIDDTSSKNINTPSSESWECRVDTKCMVLAECTGVARNNRWPFY